MNPPRPNCIICEREIFRGSSPNKETKRDDAVTCSPKCSKTYIRVGNYVKSRIDNKLKKKAKFKG